MKRQTQLALGVAAGVALVAGGVWLFSPEPELRPVPDFALLGSVGRGGQNLPADVLKLRAHLGGLGFRWVANGRKTADAELVRTIQLVQSIADGRNVVQGSGRIAPADKVAVLLRGRAPTWGTMPRGAPFLGYENFEIQDTRDNHDYGTGWMAETIAAAGERYKRTFLSDHPSAALLTVNDVSLPRGGPTPDHAGHQCGMAADLRLPRRDGAAGEIRVQDAQYDRVAMRAQLVALWRQPLVRRVLLNDRVLIGDGLCEGAAGHDHHVHFEIAAPQGHAA